MLLYTIYDRVAMEAGPVFECKNDEVAVRNYHQVIQQNVVSPGDFILYRIGEFITDPINLMPESHPVAIPVGGKNG